MKNVLISVSLLGFFCLPSAISTIPITKATPGLNVFIITTDGFRWQEVFTGADSVLINDERYTPDTATIKSLFWSADVNERRKKLMPFLWNVISRKGQLYGNRLTGNRMNTSNLYSLSYPGYNELFTGNTDLRIFNNDKKLNPNVNLLEFMSRQDSFKNKVAAFTSWDVFPYIFNQERSHLSLNSGYTKTSGEYHSETEETINNLYEIIDQKKATRFDRLSFIAAKSYLEKNHPRLFYLGLGETDEFAHSNRYDLYLQQANEVDAMIGQLWHWVQTTENYKNNTVFIITTDHGRGAKAGKWKDHGFLVNGSSQTWMACIGPGIDPLGELKTSQQIYTKQIPGMIGKLLGADFGVRDIAKKPPVD